MLLHNFYIFLSKQEHWPKGLCLTLCQQPRLYVMEIGPRELGMWQLKCNSNHLNIILQGNIRYNVHMSVAQDLYETQFMFFFNKRHVNHSTIKIDLTYKLCQNMQQFGWSKRTPSPTENLA